MTAASISIRNYAIVTAAYWAFTLTDGALRMLVLLHFNQLGYTPVQFAFLFPLYELFGIVTNLVGGWLAAWTGLRLMLVLGLPDKSAYTWVLGFVAVVLASANVVGGFVVTDRMLEMFKKREPAKPADVADDGKGDSA